MSDRNRRFNTSKSRTCVKVIEVVINYSKRFRCDVSNRDQVLELGKTVKTEVGTVTVLVNNAGIMPSHPIDQHSADEIRKIMDINIMAHFWVCGGLLQ